MFRQQNQDNLATPSIIIFIWSLYSLKVKRMIKTHRSRNLFKPPKIDQVTPIEMPPSDNPQQNATTSLLRISSEEFDFNSIDYLQIQQKVYPKPKSRQLQTPSTARSKQTTKKRLSVIDNYTESFKMNCRQNIHEVPSEDLMSNFKRHAINPSSFLIFSDDNYNNLKICDGGSQSEKQCDKNKQKLKQAKHYYSFMRKRNKSLMKQYLDLQKQVQQHQSAGSTVTNRKLVAPLNKESRISKSCELEKIPASDISIPIKILSPTKIDQSHCIQFQCTSPTFRDKRVNYRNFRLIKSKEGLKANEK